MTAEDAADDREPWEVMSMQGDRDRKTGGGARGGRRVWSRWWGLCLAMVMGWGTGGCEHPLERYEPMALTRQAMAEAHRGLGEQADRPVVAVGPGQQAGAGYEAEHRQMLEQMSGPQRYIEAPVDAGANLDGTEPQFAPLSLERATLLAVHHNLDARIARLLPAIRQTEVTEAEAQFDPALFAETNFSEVHRPQQASSLNGVPVGAEQQVQDNAKLEAGIRQRLETGTELTLSSATRHVNDKTPRLEYFPDPAWTTDAGLTVRQPLLQGLGRAINRARIELAENTHQRDRLEMQVRLAEVVRQTRTAYWELVYRQYQVAVLKQLLDITEQTLAELKARQNVDVKPVQIAQAESFVRMRRAELISVRNQMRDASDQLKSLLDDANLPLAGETVIRPTDTPQLVAIEASMRDAMDTAIRCRPELRQVLLDIRQTLIQQGVAENLELPKLDLTGELRVLGLHSDVADSYGRLGADDHMEYTFGLEFEAPLGHRAATAAASRARLARQAQSLRYRQTARQVVLAVKMAMRRLQSARRLVEVNREGRLAAAENLRALVEREKQGQPLTPEFLLDLKLTTQQRLANAELSEMRAIVDYNIAVVEFYHALGILLPRCGFEITSLEQAANGEQP